MAREYFPCYDSYLDKIKRLSDQEVGRLFRALMRYNATGEHEELAGRESVAYDFIADDIDRAKENYRSICETNKRNRSSTTVDDRGRPLTTVDETEKTKTNLKTNTNVLSTNVANTVGARNNNYNTSLEKFFRMRQEKGRPATDTEREALIESLNRFPEGDREQIIQQSITKGWLSFYPLKKAEPEKKRPETSYDIEEAIRWSETHVPKLKPKEKRE